jgi:hypothetical protein
MPQKPGETAAPAAREIHTNAAIAAAAHPRDNRRFPRVAVPLSSPLELLVMKRLHLLAAVFAIALARTAAAQEAMALLAPTKEHQNMAREVGVWDATSKIFPTPDAEAMESKGVETVKMLGQFWLVADFEGEFAGMPFQGKSQVTFDSLKKKYIGTWIDSVSAVLLTMEGDYDVEKHELTMMMEGIDAMTGQPGKWKTVTRYESEDAKTFEMYAPVEGEDGEWWKMMEIKYTRRK